MHGAFWETVKGVIGRQGFNELVWDCSKWAIKDKSVLELGCGAGYFAEIAAKIAIQYTGVDTSDASIRAAAKRVGVNQNARFISGDIVDVIGSLPTFDVVFSNDVWEHLHPHDVPSVLSALAGKLNPGGLLIIYTSARLFGPFDGSRHYLREGEPAEGLHLNETTYLEMSRLLKSAGFFSVRSPVGPAPLLRAMSKLLGSPSFLLIDAKFKTFFESSALLRRLFSRLVGIRGVAIFATSKSK
jgi:SAM-dependent methyltransferase